METPIQDIRRYVSPHLNAFGITRIANVTGLDRLNVPVYMVCRPNSRSLAVFQGKGISHESAQISGLMEAIECFHAEYAPLPVLREKFNRLQKQSQMNLAGLARIKGHVFHGQASMEWIPGRDLLGGMFKYVPFQIVHMDCTPRSVSETQFFVADTTGLASGATMAQATHHGLCEAIERDALALWSLTPQGRKAGRKIRLQAVDDSFIRTFLEHCDRADVAAAAWDITSDLDVPTYLCKVMARDYTGNGVRPAFGSGTHPSPVIALQKAVAEAAQSRITFIAGARDDQYAPHYAAQLSPDVFRRWYADIVEQPEVCDLREAPACANGKMEDCQSWLLKQLQQGGLHEVVQVDLTRAEYNIPVSKIIVPGLEGITYSGQRLIGQRGQAYMARQQACV